MRRVFTILTAAALAVASLGVGLLTADLPFWRRASQLPLAQDELYLPVAVIGAGQPVGAPARPSADAPASEVLEFAAKRARDGGSRALLVMRGDDLLLSRYFGVDDERTLMPAGLIARPMAAMAIGLALADGRIDTLDTPVVPLPEGMGRRGARPHHAATTARGNQRPRKRWRRRSPAAPFALGKPARMPEFATAKGVRMLLGTTSRSSALRFQLRHEPGGFYGTSPANVQLAAVILERATHSQYEKYLDERLWRAVGGGRAELTLDRRAGMPAAHCCWRAAAPDMLRILGLLATDGVHHGQRVLPEGWVQEMARPSRVSPESGLLVLRSNRGAGCR